MRRYIKCQCKNCSKWFKENKLHYFMDYRIRWQCPSCASIQVLSETPIKIYVDYTNCAITDEEKQYIATDVLVVKEAIETMFAEGHDKSTI